MYNALDKDYMLQEMHDSRARVTPRPRNHEPSSDALRNRDRFFTDARH